MEFLQKCTPASEGQIVGSPASFLHGAKDHLQRIDINTIPLNDTDALWQQLVACGCLLGSELPCQLFQNLQHNAGQFTAIWSHHKEAVALLNEWPQFCAPIILACVENV